MDEKLKWLDIQFKDLFKKNNNGIKRKLNNCTIHKNSTHNILLLLCGYESQSKMCFNVFFNLKMSVFLKKSGYPSYPEKPLSMA